MAVKVGDQVDYRGIKLTVVEVGEGLVHLKRNVSDSASVLVSVIEGSNRYYAMFPNEEQNKERITFDTSVPEVTAELQSQNPDHGKMWNKKWGCYAYQDNSIVAKILTEFDENTKIHTDAQSALTAYKELMEQDDTGYLLFLLHCYAYQKSSVKFDAKETATIIDSQPNVGRPMQYNKKLLEYYLASLQDDSPATELEVYNLMKLMPLKHSADTLLAFCGWDLGNRYRENGSTVGRLLSPKLIFSRKQAAELLRNLPTANDYEELV